MRWYDAMYATGVCFVLFGSLWIWVGLAGALITRAMKCN